MPEIHTLDRRVEAYNTSPFGIKYPDSQLSCHTGRFISGVWLMGNNYRNKSSLYGAYPPQYLPRITQLFPDKERVLHLFSGSLPAGEYCRFDIAQDAEVVGDAHKLSEWFVPNMFNMIYADPPYTQKDADRYGTRMINRKKVMHEVYKVLEPGGFLVWLDTSYPMFTKREFEVVGFINIVRSTNHRFRNAVIFQRV
jgi:hypothetical protein